MNMKTKWICNFFSTFKIFLNFNNSDFNYLDTLVLKGYLKYLGKHV